jgi:hypothetical protein
MLEFDRLRWSDTQSGESTPQSRALRASRGRGYRGWTAHVFPRVRQQIAAGSAATQIAARLCLRRRKGSHSIRDAARWLDFSPRKFTQTPSLMPLVGLFPHDLPTCLKRAVVGPEGSRPRASLSRDATHLLPIRHAAVMSRGENPTDVRVRHFQ